MRVIVYADLQDSDVVLIEMGDEVHVVTVKKDENGAISLGENLSMDYAPGHLMVVLSRGRFFPKRIKYEEQEIIFFGKAVPIKRVGYVSRKHNTSYEIPKELQRNEEGVKNYVREKVLECVSEIPSGAKLIMKES